MDIASILALIPAAAPYAGYATAAVGIAAIVASVLPPPTANTGWYSAVYKVINWLGANKLHATNLTDPAVPASVKTAAANATPAPAPTTPAAN